MSKCHILGVGRRPVLLGRLLGRLLGGLLGGLLGRRGALVVVLFVMLALGVVAGHMDLSVVDGHTDRAAISRRRRCLAQEARIGLVGADGRIVAAAVLVLPAVIITLARVLGLFVHTAGEGFA